MSVYYHIDVIICAEGECVYRKKDAVIPRIPNWSSYNEGGRTFEKWFDNHPAKLPYKRRLFRHNLYYKAYHVEYHVRNHSTTDGVINTPSEDYLNRFCQLVKPLPGEKLKERMATIESTKPFIYHYIDFYYRFEEVEGTTHAILEKEEEGRLRR